MPTPFSAAKMNFTPQVQGELLEYSNEADGLPPPKRVKIQQRRMAGIREARAILGQLPELGESLHVLCTARMDMSDTINAMFEELGPCEELRIATLGMNKRNQVAIVGWLDSGLCTRFAMLLSGFFRSMQGELAAETQERIQKRGHHIAFGRNHAKVITMSFASGAKYSIEGSANLCGNGDGREQFALVNHPELHDWHSAWIDAMIEKHESHTT